MSASSMEDLPGWPEAVSTLSQLLADHGEEARSRAGEYGQTYAGRRAGMVFDVVASQQRRYTARVLPMVAAFEETLAAESLEMLAQTGPGEGHGLRRGEGETMRMVASGLVEYTWRHGLDLEQGVKAWAEGCSDFAHASKLEPHVGCVKGIGPALFAYLRMRCGADGIKPDLRVRDGLNSAGLSVPNDAHSILVVATAVAAALDVPLLVLDQLLWWQNGS